jgi:putative transposase
MKYNPDIHHRRAIRLKGYDYSQEGLYYITICTYNHLHLFGKIENREMILNNAGRMVEQQWRELVCRFENIKLREFIVMPNHFHGIVESVGVPLWGTQNDRQTQETRQPQGIGQPQGIAPTVGDVVGAFKSLTTNDYIRKVKQKNWQSFDKKLWQRNFYEHIIRDQESNLKIAEYIQTNPLKWREDKYYG